MEAGLQDYLDSYESTHDYDEYHFDLDSIAHDPYVLLSILSVLHEGAWTLDQVQGTLETLVDRQYILTEDVVVEAVSYTHLGFLNARRAPLKKTENILVFYQKLPDIVFG